MNGRGHAQFDDLVCSFLEIRKFDRRLFIILLINVIIKSIQPFPNIIFSGLIIDSITRGGDLFCIFMLHRHYVWSKLFSCGHRHIPRKSKRVFIFEI